MQANTNIGLGFSATIGMFFLAAIGVSCLTFGLVDSLSTWPPDWGRLWTGMIELGGDLALINLFLISSAVNIYFSVKKHRKIQELNEEIEWYAQQKQPEAASAKPLVSEDDVIRELENDYKSNKYDQDVKHWDSLLKTRRVREHEGARKKCLTYRTYANRRKKRYANADESTGVQLGEEIML